MAQGNSSAICQGGGMSRIGKVLFVFAAFSALAACSSSGEPPAELNPGKALRSAYAANMQVYAAQLSQLQNVRGELPQGDGVQVLIDSGIKAVPKTDAWGLELRYHNDGVHWILSSAGPDMQWKTRDDIVIEDGQMK